jgi:hypothetical protein
MIRIGRLALIALLACGPRVKASEPGPMEAAPPKPLETHVSYPASFKDGPPILPADALLAWLQKAGTKRVRLPMHITSSPLGVTRATVGSSAEALALTLDSTALSMMIEDHLHRHCGDTNPCSVWVEGTWGPLMAMPGPPRPGHTFAVRAVVGPVQPGDSLVARVQE